MRFFEEPSPGTPMGVVDPRPRVLGAFAFAVVAVSLDRWIALGVALGLAVAAAGLAGMCRVASLRRLTELNLFSLLLVVFLPLSTPGAPALAMGPLVWTREGFLLAGAIALKANAIMIACGALLATVEPARLGHALARLGLPDRLAHIFLFMVRYIEVLHREYHRLANAMRLRGFRPTCTAHGLRSLGYLVGMLFLRSIERAERILDAMKCRGFEGRLHILDPQRLGRADVVFSLVAVACLATLGATEYWPWTR